VLVNGVAAYDGIDMEDEFTLGTRSPLEGLLPPRVASILATKGIRTIEDVRNAYPHQLLKIRGLGLLRFRQIERALFPGKSFTPARVQSPISHVKGSSLNGVLNPATVRALARGGITTPEKLHDVTSKDLLKIPGLGISMVQEIEQVFLHR